jgi:hypothetical protein
MITVSTILTGSDINLSDISIRTFLWRRNIWLWHVSWIIFHPHHTVRRDTLDYGHGSSATHGDSMSPSNVYLLYRPRCLPQALMLSVRAVMCAEGQLVLGTDQTATSGKKKRSGLEIISGTERLCSCQHACWSTERWLWCAWHINRTRNCAGHLVLWCAVKNREHIVRTIPAYCRFFSHGAGCPCSGQC